MPFVFFFSIFICVYFFFIIQRVTWAQWFGQSTPLRSSDVRSQTSVEPTADAFFDLEEEESEAFSCVQSKFKTLSLTLQKQDVYY